MTEHQLQQFFRDVCINERIDDWKLNFTTDSYCWIDKKLIDVDWSYDGDLRQIILHEIAHISTCKYSNNKHTQAFWKYNEYLCRKYLREELDLNQQRHREFQGKGIYSLIYADFPVSKKFQKNFSTGKILGN
jgi:hypothetical protein